MILFFLDPISNNIENSDWKGEYGCIHVVRKSRAFLYKRRLAIFLIK